MTSTVVPAPPPADVAHSVVYRHYQGPGELPGMMEANRRLRTLCGILEPIDMASIEHRYSHLVNSDPLVDCIVVTRDGETVGYARVEWHNLVDGDRMYDHTLVVAPDAWGLGITDALLEWCEGRQRQIAERHIDGRRGWLSTFLFSGDVEGQAAFERSGYEIVRFGADMLRPDLERLPPVVVPDGYVLRTPVAEELPAVHAMNVEAFRDHWGEPEEPAEDTFAEWIEDPRFALDLLAVAWHGDQPACLVGGMREPQADGSIRGYVSSVGTQPQHRRRGLARAMLTEVLHRLRDAGATSAYLGVDAQNQRAFALYEELGFHKEGTETVWRKALHGAEDGE